MSWRHRGFVALMTLFLLAAASTIEKDQDDRLRLIHADLLQHESIEDKIIRKLVGNVEFQQGETTIQCDVATQLFEEDVYVLAGNVHIFDKERSLTADTVYIYETEKKQVAVGRVKSIENNQITRADRITHLDEQNRVLSEGHVMLENAEDRSVIRGGRAEYWLDTERGQITQEPLYIESDTLGVEITRIKSDTMEVIDARDLMIALKNVVITQKTTLATCNVAEFYKLQDEIHLTGSPEVVQKNQTIAGDTLNLFLEKSAIARAEIIGNAMATSDADTSSKGRWLNKMTGNRMHFYFEDGQVQRIVIEDQAISIYHIIEDEQYKGVSEVSGDKITVEFSDEKAEKVVVTSHPDVAAGKFTPVN